MFAAIKSFIEDMQRRRVFRAAALYAAVAWATTEVLSIVLPAFGDSGTWLRAAIVVAVAGFPIVVVLAWVFDVTPHGVDVTVEAGAPPARARRQRWVRFAVATPLVVGVVAGTTWLWTAQLAHTGESEFTQQVRPDEMPVVAVLPLENLSGRQDLAWAGAGLATLIRDDLSQSRFMAVVAASRTLRMLKDTPKVEDLFTSALDAGITHVLTGEILRTPKGLTVTTRLTDLRRSVEAGANRQEGLQPEELMGVATPVTSLIKQSLGVPGTEKVDVFATDFATKNLAAYEAFIVGMQNFLAFNYAAARDLFQAAVDKAPDFALARYRLAHTLAALGDTAAALEQIRTARKDGFRLPQKEQDYIAAGESYFAMNYAEAERQYRAILEAHPYESEAHALLLYVLNAQGRHEQALVEAEALVAQDPGDETAWSSTADLNLKLGRYEAAEEAIAKLLELAPDNPNALYLAGEAKFLREQFDAAAPDYEKALAIDAGFGEALQRLAHIEVLSGKPAAAIERLRAMAASPAFSLAHQTTATVDAAYLLRAAGQPAEADALLAARAQDFATEKIMDSLALALRARCQIELGNVGEALRLAQESVARSPGRPTRYLVARGLAEIAAQDFAALERTVAEVRAVPGSNDATEQKAADFLAGAAALKRGDPAAAVTHLRAAVQGEGREYESYRLALAEVLAAQGDKSAAADMAREAAARGNLSDFSLEFEAARRQASELAARLRG